MKNIIRVCDNCKKDIPDMYKYGVTTLFRDIRVGRGGSFHDYREGTIFNDMKVEQANDYDSYGKGWKSDEDKEFCFCCPECVFVFLGKLYNDTFTASAKYLKEKKLEDSERLLKDMEERAKENPVKKFFTPSLSKMWIEAGLEELEEHKKQINNNIKIIEELNQKVSKR